MRASKSRQGFGHRGMDAANARQPLGEDRLEEREPPVGRARPSQPFLELVYPASPEIFEQRVALRELAGGDAEQQRRRARNQLRAHRPDRLGDVAHVVSGARTADDRSPDHASCSIFRSVEEPQRRTREPEHDVDRARRKHMLAPLARGRGAAIVPGDPEGPDEGPERRGWVRV